MREQKDKECGRIRGGFAGAERAVAATPQMRGGGGEMVLPCQLSVLAVTTAGMCAAPAWRPGERAPDVGVDGFTHRKGSPTLGLLVR